MELARAQSGEQPKKNLWSSLLNSVGQRKDMPQAHLLILGDRGAGKRSLVRKMNKPFMKLSANQINKMEEIGSDYANFDSSYLYF